MADARIPSQPKPVKPATGATPPAANAGRPAGTPPAAAAAGDALALSPEARAALAARQAKAAPATPVAPATPAAPGRKADGSNVSVEVTNRDVTVEAQLGERTRVVARKITNSPTMMDGASLIKLERDLGDHTTAFVGAGDLPGFYRHTIGANRRVDAPHTAAFFGVEDVRGARRPLGLGVDLDLRLHSIAVGTAAYNREKGGFDASTSAGLSKATTTGEIGLSRRFGAVDASVGYGHHLDFGQIGSYYVTGGQGLFPTTQWLQAGVGTRAAGMDLRLDGYVPLATSSNEFDARAKVRASASGARYLPDVGVTASAAGLERVDLSKGVAIARDWQAEAMVSAWRPLGDQPVVQAGVGVRWTPGGKPTRRGPARPADDWRTTAPTRRPAAAARVGQPRLEQWFTPEQIAAMRGQSVEALAKVLRTPEQVVAYNERFVAYDDARLKDPKGDYGSLTPNDVARLLAGVCRDQHPFMLAVMKEGGAIQAGHAIGYMSPDTSHAIAVYQDPATGKWNVAEYGRIHYTQAATAEEAFEAVRPDALVYGDWGQGGPNDKNAQRTIRYSETAREFYRFVQPGRN